MNTSGSFKSPKGSKTGFSPVKLPQSPLSAGNLTGLKRTTKDLAADIYNNIQKWNDLHLKGCEFVKTVSNVKNDDPSCLSDELEKVCCELQDVVTSMEKYKNSISASAMQMRTLERLSTADEPLFISLNVKALIALIEPIALAYQNEYQNKIFIADNIPFTKSSLDASFLSVLWTYQSCITKQVNLNLEALLTEVGHRKY